MQCEICNMEFPKLDTHHIRSKSKGGNNSKSNLAKLCCNCHRLVHLGEIIIEGKFPSTGKGGYSLIHRNKNEESIMNLPLPEIYIIGGKSD